jgi:hypothetical protein
LTRRDPAITPTGAELARVDMEAARFQERVDVWLLACFGSEISRDKIERNHRFLEEALELVQSAGCTKSEAHQLVDYVYGRDIGEMSQEIGGVMNTLAAPCLAHGHDMTKAGDAELARCWTKIEKIRAKQAAKPKHSPLPERPSTATPPTLESIARMIETRFHDCANVARAVREMRPDSDDEAAELRRRLDVAKEALESVRENQWPYMESGDFDGDKQRHADRIGQALAAIDAPMKET